MSHLYAGRAAAVFPGGPMEREVLVHLWLHADHRDPAKPVSPPIVRLALLIRAGTTAIRAALRTLENDGWIAAAGNRKGGREKGTAYRLNIEQIKAAPDRSKFLTDELNPTPRVAFAATNPTPERAKPNVNDPINPTPRVAEQGSYNKVRTRGDSRTLTQARERTPPRTREPQGLSLKSQTGKDSPSGVIPGWWISEAATTATAQALGMGNARSGESWPEYRARIHAEINRRKAIR